MKPHSTTPTSLGPPNRLRHELIVSCGTVRLRTTTNYSAETGDKRKPDLRGVPDPQLSFEDCVRDRRAISRWSQKSRVRMMYRLATIDWTAVDGVMEMVTLTYPREFPTDGRVAKAHLQAFRKRCIRRWGEDYTLGTWKMEFQRRGAPHFHLYVNRPPVAWVEWLGWARRAWFEIVGSGDRRHLDQGVRIDRQFCSKARSSKAIAWYFSKHGLKAGAGKAYQNDVPEGYERCGRFWGVWGLTSTETEIEIDTRDFIELRRLLVRFRRAATGRKNIKVPGRLIGTWAMSHDGFGFTAQALRSIGVEVDAQQLVDLRVGELVLQT